MGRKKLEQPPRKDRIIPIVLSPQIREYLSKRRFLKKQATAKHVRNLIISDIQQNPSDYGIGN